MEINAFTLVYIGLILLALIILLSSVKVVPQSIKDAMEKQMRAEREKRAVIAESEGEKQAKINVAEGSEQLLWPSMKKVERMLST